MKWCVYKHSCPNGKAYIGITSQEPTARWGGGMGYSENKEFFKYILKVGWDNIDHKIIASGLSEQMARRIEREMIKESRLSSYNITHKYKDAPTQRFNDSDYSISEYNTILLWSVFLFGNTMNESLFYVVEQYDKEWRDTLEQLSKNQDNLETCCEVIARAREMAVVKKKECRIYRHSVEKNAF